MNKDKEQFETTSLLLATTLVSLGFTLSSVDKIESHKAVFIFLKSNHLMECVTNFWEKSILLEPHTFYESMRFVKSRLYGESQNG